MCTQILLGEVVQHASVYQTLHEVAAILRQAQTRQPLISYPLMIHVSVCQGLETKGYGLSFGNLNEESTFRGFRETFWIWIDFY